MGVACCCQLMHRIRELRVGGGPANSSGSSILIIMGDVAQPQAIPAVWRYWPRSSAPHPSEPFHRHPPASLVLEIGGLGACSGARAVLHLAGISLRPVTSSKESDANDLMGGAMISGDSSPIPIPALELDWLWRGGNFRRGRGRCRAATLHLRWDRQPKHMSAWRESELVKSGEHRRSVSADSPRVYSFGLAKRAVQI
jgi:hypothetical protein